MIKFIKVFLAVLLLLCVIASTAYLMHKLSLRLDNILTPENPAVKQSDEKITVIIDAGHGGFDGGAVGLSGTLEKDLNLAVAQKLKVLLEFENINVIMTRQTDEMLTYDGIKSAKTADLKARLEIAQNTENCIFISIHMNKFTSESVNGFTVYYSPNNLESKPIAEMIKSNLTEKIQPQNNRVLKKADSSIYILNRITRPAVLIECGFLSNRQEEAVLLQDEYQSRLAAAICEATADYIKQMSYR